MAVVEGNKSHSIEAAMQGLARPPVPKAPSKPKVKAKTQEPGFFQADPSVLQVAWVLWVVGFGVAKWMNLFAILPGVAPCRLHPVTHTKILGYFALCYSFARSRALLAAPLGRC